MYNIKINKYLKQGSLALGLILASLSFAGCGGSSSSSNTTVNKTFRVTYTNVSNNQPMSPLAVVVHKAGYQLFQAGQAASLGLEKLAEGGSNAELLAEASQHADYIASQVGTGIVPPSASETIEIMTMGDTTDLKLSVTSMLVNTNDAFAGVSSGKIALLAKGERFAMHVPVWDAGTEANTEATGTLPGPADGGEGFNASRTGDADFVAIHQGVVTNADGLSTSVLNESHRFDNPVALISVERLK